MAATLQENEPCPVCGSVHHPHPNVLLDKGDILSREQLEDLEKEVNSSNQKREQLARDIDAKQLQCKQKEETYQSTYKQVTQLYENETLLFAAIKNWNKQKEALENLCTKKAEIEKEASQMDEKVQSLQVKIQENQKKLVDSQKREEGLRSQMESLTSTLFYPDKEQAHQALDASKQKQTLAKQADEQANVSYQENHTQLENAKVRIVQFQDMLPSLIKETTEKENVYQQKENDLKNWKEWTSSYSKTDVEHLQKEVETYHQQVAATQATKQTAQKTIQSKEKPNLESLQVQVEIEKQKLDEVQSQFNNLAIRLENNEQIETSLVAQTQNEARK